MRVCLYLNWKYMHKVYKIYTWNRSYQHNNHKIYSASNWTNEIWSSWGLKMMNSTKIVYVEDGGDAVNNDETVDALWFSCYFYLIHFVICSLALLLFSFSRSHAQFHWSSCNSVRPDGLPSFQFTSQKHKHTGCLLGCVRIKQRNTIKNVK